MKKAVIFLVLVSCTGLILQAQDITKEPFYSVKTPDHVALDEKVPDIYATEVSFDRTLVVRLKHQKDILEGLNDFVKQEKIKNAVIITGIGSVTGYHIHVVDNADFPSENAFVEKDIPMDVTNITGYVIDGRVHAHITLSDEHEAIGGHLEPGTPVFTFCIITVGILKEGAVLKRFDDKTLR